MADRYVAVLDAGTSSVRCFILDQSARIAASRSSPWRYLDAEDASPYAREFDPAQVWTCVCGLLMDALRDARASPDQIAAVTATSQRQGVVFLDADGREIYAGPNLDLRAVFEGGAIDDQMRERIYETTGHAPSFLLAPAKLRWFQRHRPDAYDKIASVLTLADWLVYRLAGTMASEPTLAAEAGLLDIHRRRWCSDIMDDLGLLDNSHVTLVDAGTAVGSVSDGVSRETGIPAGTSVVVSGADTQCGLLGMGVIGERQLGIVSGWSTPLQMVTGRPILSQEARTWAGCHPLEQKWTLESTAGDTGNSYRWLADILWGEGGNAFSQMDTLASTVRAGSEGVFAFLGPSRMDMNRLGLRKGGLFFPVPMTLSEMDRNHLTRAALEAIAYAVNANLEQVEGMTGESVADIAVGGGMTQTSTWVRVLADVVGREIKVSPTPQVTALGAYLCAAKAIGELDSIEEGARGLTDQLRTIEPDPLAHLEYLDHYQRWTEWMDLSSQLEGLGP